MAFFNRLTVWRVALVTPLMAGALAWLWIEVTLPAAACARDDRGGLRVTAGLVVLFILAPAATAWQAWQARRSVARTVLAVVVSGLLAAVAVDVAYVVWWFGHNCYD
jgi:hypothetical protein